MVKITLDNLRNADYTLYSEKYFSVYQKLEGDEENIHSARNQLV